MTVDGDGNGRSGGPLVSLVMATWNPNPAWLREAVASALAQEGCEVELIVVDDGSPSPVADLLGDVDDDRMQVLRVPHGRVSRARNAGLEVARGDYVRFIDCDDVILPESTSNLLALVAGEDGLIGYGATLACDEHLRPLSLISSTLQGQVAESCLLNRFSVTIHSLLFPRQVVDAVGPWEPSIVVSQDWDYSLRAFELAPVRGDQRVATHYRMHAAMNSRNVEEGIRGYRLVVDRYFERHPDRRGERLHRRAIALFHVFAAAQAPASLRKRTGALGHVRRALVLDPLVALSALRRQATMPLVPTARRVRRFLPRRWRRRG